MAENIVAGAAGAAPANHWIDPVFAAVLQERGYIDNALTVTPAEVAGIEDLDVSGNPDCMGVITSLRGLNHFTALRSLDCSFNRIVALDLSGNPLLAELYCLYNRLTGLNLSANRQLTEVVCSKNEIEALNISHNPCLSQLSCDRNRLATLDLRGATSLEALVCNDNQLKGLDISTNKSLEVLVCMDNPGLDGTFIVKGPYQGTPPSETFTTALWTYKNSQVTIKYCHQL